MIDVKEDRIGNFVEVVHTGSGDLFRLHQDDVLKVGTQTKVAVYEKKPIDFMPPSAKCPKGMYRARVKYFVATYLQLPQVAVS